MANAKVTTTLEAIDKASGVINKVAGSMDKAGKSFSDFADEIPGLNQAMSLLTNPVALAGAGIAAAGKFAVDATNETLAYNKSITDLAQNLGRSTEETSRIIQTMDDFTVSQESVTAALEMALKNGFAPSIDTLAEMADKYNEIQDPTERAAKLTEVFGKNWTELVPALKQGGQAIRDAAAAQNKAMLVTDESAKAAREYEVAMDSLGDSVTALKYKVGNGLIPTLTKVAEAMNKDILFADLLAEAGERQIKLDYKMTGSGVAYAETIESLTEKIKQYDEEQKKSVIAQEDFREGERSTTPVIEDHTEAELRLAESMDRRASVTDEVTEATEQATAAGIALYNQDILAAEAMKTYTAELLYNKVAANLDADAALSLATQMGLVDERTIQATERLNAITSAFDTNKDGIVSADEGLKEYLATVAALNAQILALPEDSYVTIHVRTEGMESLGAVASFTNAQGQVVAEARADGGPVSAGNPYWVGDGGEPELFVPNQNGTIVPAHNMPGGSGQTINIYFQGPVNSMADAKTGANQGVLAALRASGRA